MYPAHSVLLFGRSVPFGHSGRSDTPFGSSVGDSVLFGHSVLFGDSVLFFASVPSKCSMIASGHALDHVYR